MKPDVHLQPNLRRIFVTLSVVLTAALAPARADLAGEVRVRSFEQLNQGVAAYNRGEFRAAVEHLRKSSELALSSFRAHYYLGLALIGAREYTEALTAIQIALDLEPKHLQALVALGDAHLKLGDLGEARAAYYRALKLRAEFAPALDGLARAYVSQADDERAIEHFRRSIAADKGFAVAYANLGDLYLQRGRLADAVALLEEAVAVRPDFAMGLDRLARAYGRLGLMPQAMATVQRAFALEPDHPDHYVTLGWLQLDQSAHAAAEASFLRALSLDPKSPVGREGLAEVARRRGDWTAMFEQFDLALATPGIEPAVAVRLRERRTALIEERDRSAALEAEIEGGAATPEQFTALAAEYASRGRWDEAIALQGCAATSSGGQEQLAYLLFRAGRYREALTRYTDLAGDSDDGRVELNRGATLAALGDDHGALAAYEKAAALSPRLAPAHLYTANARLRLGRPAEAASAYRAYLELAREGDAVEPVRRILRQIAPELAPPSPAVLPPPPPLPPRPASAEDSDPGTPEAT